MNEFFMIFIFHFFGFTWISIQSGFISAFSIYISILFSLILTITVVELF